MDNGIKLILFPLAKEICCNNNDLPLSREDLESFTRKIEEENPKISIDYSLLDYDWINNADVPARIKTHYQNTWFVDIMEDKMLKTYLKYEMNSDPTNMTLTHQVIMDTYKKGRGVENNIGIYNRVK